MVLSPVPLGAGRLTRDHLPDDPPDHQAIKKLRKYVRAELAAPLPELARLGPAEHIVGTSKTFKQLARLCGAAPSSAGPYVQRMLRRDQLEDWVPRLAKMTAHERSTLPGISEGRAHQIFAGALVAVSAMEVFDASRVTICPWALREGVILRRLDWMRDD